MAGMFLATAALAQESPARTAPNIVLILADDLGYSDLGCFGQETLKTPRLDAMAKQGMRFTQFYAGCTVCAPSRCVL
ncbi:MAG: sulfatase-like hydrolase/transferase, partial [bacterium]|nr:sulfatase-like hydrolase/transferase [bacterium]